MTTTLRAALLLGILGLASCDSLPGALDEGGGGDGGPPPATKAYLRIENHGPTMQADSLIGGECAYEPLPKDSVRYVFTLPASGVRVQQVPGDRCFDYTLFVTLPGPGYVGPYQTYSLGPPAGDTITIHLYDPT